MHNFYTRPSKDGSEERQNWDNIEKYSRVHDYRIYLGADMFTPDPGFVIAPIRKAYTGGPYLAHNPSNLAGSRFSFRRPETWEAGYIKIKSVDYTGTSNTGNYIGHFRIDLYTDAITLNAAGSVFVVNTGFVISPPGTAHFKTTFDPFASSNTFKVNIDPSFTYIAITIFRDGTSVSDTNAGDWNFLGCTVEYVETKRNFGKKVNHD